MRLRSLGLRVAACLIAVPAAMLGADAFLHWEPNSAPPAMVDVTPDVDAYVRMREDSVPGVKPALRKGIVWRDSSHRRTSLAIVYLHGFSASRAELSPVVERLADSLDANVFFARLAAHGRVDGEAFATVTAQDWMDDAEEAYAIGHRIGDRIVLVGTSTGALLAMAVASAHWGYAQAEHPAALILISPNHQPADGRAMLAAGPFGRIVARVGEGRYHHFTPVNALHAERWNTQVRSEGLSAMMNLVRYAQSLDVSQITVPLLTLYTHHDDVVRVDLIRSRHQEFGSRVKEIVDVPSATNHVLAGDALGPAATADVVNLMVTFLRANVPTDTVPALAR